MTRAHQSGFAARTGWRGDRPRRGRGDRPAALGPEAEARWRGLCELASQAAEHDESDPVALAAERAALKGLNMPVALTAKLAFWALLNQIDLYCMASPRERPGYGPLLKGLADQAWASTFPATPPDPRFPEDR